MPIVVNTKLRHRSSIQSITCQRVTSQSLARLSSGDRITVSGRRWRSCSGNKLDSHAKRPEAVLNNHQMHYLTFNCKMEHLIQWAI